MTEEALKAFLQTPIALFALMLFASLLSMFKEIYQSNKVAGTGMTLGIYLAHWPETVITISSNAIAFVTLVMTEQLNFASALGIGYLANSASGIIGSVVGSSRSASLINSPPKE